MMGCYFLVNSDICVRIPEPPAGEPVLSIDGCYFLFNSDICVRIPEPPAGEPGLSIDGLLFPV